ncbi:hypothetical protein [Ferrovum sp.]|uniref:hypothetical protein n=1 Tax=Ferrovum sp. TaxID=2609467 RepID=UPI00261F7B46|nr:hypothetical protein [Ferrovum sp.]
MRPEANIELYISLLGGTVISLFLIVGQVVALRSRVAAVRKRWANFHRHKNWFPLILEILGVSGFFLVQPFLIGYLIVLSLDGFTPVFSTHLIQEFHRIFR